MNVPVLQKAQMYIDKQIRTANEILNYAIKQFSDPDSMVDLKKMKGLSLKNTLKTINEVYQKFFDGVLKEKYSINQALYYFTYRFIDLKYSKKGHVEKNYQIVKAFFVF